MRDTRDPYGLGTLVLYLALSCFFFGRGLIGHFYTSHIGESNDPPLMMWFLAWWPHAIANRLNPFLTHAYWAPSGFNLTWSPSIPIISVAAAPLTAALGPIASLNILCLISLPLAGWCAFLLCWYTSGDYWTSALGGYIFGFCPTLLGQILFGRLHAVFVFPIPLAAYLVIRRFGMDIGAWQFAMSLAVVLVVQFLSSPELFATMTLFGSMIIGTAWLQASREVRFRLNNIIISIGYGYVIALLVVSPYFYYMFFLSRPFQGPIWSDRMLSSDLLNFLIPTPLNELGRIPFFDRLSAPFNWGLPSEGVAFLNWPLCVMAVLFTRKYFQEQRGRLLADSLVIILVCSLGSALIIRGRPTKILLPWSMLGRSVLNNAAPARFCMYAFLLFAVMASIWLSSVRIRPHFKLAVAAAIVACQLPNLSAAYWVSPFRTPEFFRANLYRDYLIKGETVFIFSVWPLNDSMVWQAQTHMYFNLGQGPGPWPADVAKWPIVDTFFQQQYVPDAPVQFNAYLLNHGVRAIIVDDESLPTWAAVLSSLGVDPIKVGGVSLYRMPPQQSTTKTIAELRTRFDVERYEILLTAIQKYLSNGGNPEMLIAKDLVELGLVPTSCLIGPLAPPEIRAPEENWWRAPNFKYGIYLFITDNHLIALGERAWQPAARNLIDAYRAIATEADFVPPQGSTAPKSDQIGVVVMSFTRQQLAKAATIANANLLKERDAKPETTEDHTGR